MRKAFASGLLVMVLLFLTNCSTFELRSPIVIHSGEKSAKQDTTPPVQAKVEIPEAAPSGDLKTDITSPASIQVLSNQDMGTSKFSVLGRIRVKSPDKNGFNKEDAIKELKIMAFKRYGSLAQGLSNIGYIEKAGLVSTDQSLYREASADVMTMAEASQPGSAGEGASSEARDTIPPLEKIAVVTSNDLFDRNFRVLGKVSIRDESPNGFSEEQGIKSLKIEAYRLYGARARGLTNVKLKKADPIYFYKKPQFSPPPKVPDGYNRAYAEVVYWP